MNDLIRYGLMAERFVAFHDIAAPNCPVLGSDGVRTEEQEIGTKVFWDRVLPLMDPYGFKLAAIVGKKVDGYGIGVWERLRKRLP